MKERDRLTRHSNILLIWHDTGNTKTACIWLALGSHDVSVLESNHSQRMTRESASRISSASANETNDDERVNESGERGQFVHFKESFVRTDSFANEPTLVVRGVNYVRNKSLFLAVVSNQCQIPPGDLGVGIFHAVEPLEGSVVQAEGEWAPQQVIPQSIDRPTGWPGTPSSLEKVTAAACGKAEHDVKPRLDRSSHAHNHTAHTFSGCG